MTKLRSHFFTFLFLSAVALLLVVLDQSRRLDAPQDWGQRLTLPAESWLSGMGQGVTGFFDTLRDFRTLKADNDAMRAQLAQLTLVNVQYTELKQENEQLRALLNFQESNPNFTLQAAEVVEREIPARVIGEEISNLVQSVRIDQGRESGVEIGMSVITPQGLIGQVSEAGEGWAKVVLVTDQSSSITAYVQEGRASGMVQGVGDGLTMRYIPHEQRVEQGDVVMTAGLGGKFPKGLVIGVVESVERSDINPWQEAVVRSSINFEQLEYVFVIRTFVPQPPEATP